MNRTLLTLKQAHKGLENLRRDTNHIIPMEMHEGMGDMLVRLYGGLLKSVQSVSNDAFLEAMIVDLPENASDQQKVVQINILSGQLLSFVEGLYYMLEAESEVNTDDEDDDQRTMRRFNQMMDK